MIGDRSDGMRLKAKATTAAGTGGQLMAHDSRPRFIPNEPRLADKRHIELSDFPRVYCR